MTVRDKDTAPHELETPPPPEGPSRRSSITPLPVAVPYHVADPTTSPHRVAPEELALPAPPDEDLAAELETRQVPRISSQELEMISQPPPPVEPTAEIDKVDLDEMLTPVPPASWGRPSIPLHDAPRDPPTDPDVLRRATRGSDATTPRVGASPPPSILGPGTSSPDDNDLTKPRALVEADPLANAFFVALPAHRRQAALGRCTRRSVRAGTTVIRQGEMSHPLFMVVTGRLELRVERADATLAIVDTIEAGQYVGEAALLGRTASSMQVVAAVDSQLLALPPHALFELAGAFPQLWSALKDTAERRTKQLDTLR